MGVRKKAHKRCGTKTNLVLACRFNTFFPSGADKTRPEIRACVSSRAWIENICHHHADNDGQDKAPTAPLPSTRIFAPVLLRSVERPVDFFAASVAVEGKDILSSVFHDWHLVWSKGGFGQAHVNTQHFPSGSDSHHLRLLHGAAGSQQRADKAGPILVRPRLRINCRSNSVPCLVPKNHLAMRGQLQFISR